MQSKFHDREHEDVTVDELLRRYAAGERLFEYVDLADGAKLNGASLEGATFRYGIFSDIDARGANLRGVTFQDMNLKCTDFRGADLTDAVFDDVLIEAAVFKGAVVTNAVFQRMWYHGNEIKDFCPDELDL